MLKKLGYLLLASSFYLSNNSNASNLIDPQPPFNPNLEQGVLNPFKAPKIIAQQWLNTPETLNVPIQGNVTLVNFWTFSAVDCLQALSHLQEWHKSYAAKGLTIIGVHTPEFNFEKQPENIKNILTKYHITYPIALDNSQKNWQMYRNQIWPAYYLIDQKGYVVYQHFGAGDYALTENNIRALLGLPKKFSKIDPVINNKSITPDTYFGYARADGFVQTSPKKFDVTSFYRFPIALFRHTWALEGAWKIQADKIVAQQLNSALKVRFNAKKVFAIVNKTSDKPIKVAITLNGKPLTNNAGKDLKNSELVIKTPGTYEILADSIPEEGVLQLTANEPGVEIYAFNFV